MIGLVMPLFAVAELVGGVAVGRISDRCVRWPPARDDRHSLTADSAVGLLWQGRGAGLAIGAAATLAA